MVIQSPLAIYVHWPWCKAKCPYCDFNSHAGTIQEQAYVSGLLKELNGWREGFLIDGLQTKPLGDSGRPIASLFFGGGTPSLMSVQNIEKIVNAAGELGIWTPQTEVTVECNPTSFDDKRPAKAFFEDLQRAGVNRVSIGIQGLNQDWLTFLGRSHKVDEALATLDAAQTVFKNVNADVIYGLPGQKLEEWRKLLEMLAGRRLAHISAYQLTIEKNTRFYSDVRRGRWVPIDADLEADFFDLSRETLLAQGYNNYEISNFSRNGLECAHNRHIWQYGDYIGVGAGAHGRITDIYNRTVATQVIRQPEGYLKLIRDHSSAFSRLEALNATEAAQEAVFSGLRLKMGIDSNHLSKRFGKDAYLGAVDADEIDSMVDAGFLIRSDNRIALSPTGWPRLNSVLSRILRPLSTVELPLPQSDASNHNAYTSIRNVVIE